MRDGPQFIGEPIRELVGRFTIIGKLGFSETVVRWFRSKPKLANRDLAYDPARHEPVERVLRWIKP